MSGTRVPLKHTILVSADRAGGIFSPMSTEAERERKRVDRKIAQLESQVAALRECVEILAKHADVGRDAGPVILREVRQKLVAEQARRPG